MIPFDLICDFLGDLKLLCMLKCVQRLLVRVNLICDVLTNINQIACTLVSFSTKCFLHDGLLALLRNIVIIQLPPQLLSSVEDIRVVVAILCKAVVDHDGMQMIRSLLFFGVWLLQNLFSLLDLIVKQFSLRLGCHPELTEHGLGNLDILFSDTKLTLAQLVRIEEFKSLALDI